MKHILDNYHKGKINWLSVRASVSRPVQFGCSVVSDSLWPHGLPGLPVHRQLPQFTQIHVRWVGDAIQPSHPLSSPSPPNFNLSQHQGLFKWLSSSHQVAEGLKFQLPRQSFNEYSGLISFRMDWLDLLAVQGTLKSLLQCQSSEASVLWGSAFFIVHCHIHTCPLETP